MAEKMTRHIVSFPVGLANDIKALATERGQTFSGAIREIIRVRITREKRTKVSHAKDKNIQERSIGRGHQ